MQGVTRRCQTPTLAGPSRNARYRHAQDSQACKRSAVRARLAPQVRVLIRTVRAASTAAKYSNGGRLAAVPVFGSGTFPRQSCWPDTGFQALNRPWSACHLGKSQSRLSRDLCCRSPPAPPVGLFLPVTVAVFASGLAALAVPIHSAEPRPLARVALADGMLGGRAQRVTPRMSIRRWGLLVQFSASLLEADGAGCWLVDGERAASLDGCLVWTWSPRP